LCTNVFFGMNPCFTSLLKRIIHFNVEPRTYNEISSTWACTIISQQQILQLYKESLSDVFLIYKFRHVRYPPIIQDSYVLSQSYGIAIESHQSSIGVQFGPFTARCEILANNTTKCWFYSEFTRLTKMLPSHSENG